ncbi:hypothetical protein ACIBTZ_32645 [Micromonospora sp. NPDC049460]|uniref:hypothetical protein n=1 Tax=Micromonospora sp. NPDC049460 TaxID=3364272 RepID=UPI0037A64A72
MDQLIAQRAAQSIQRLSDENWRALDLSCKALEDDAWVGPEGRRFNDEVHAMRRVLQAQLSRAVHNAKAKLQSLEPLPKRP